MIKQIHVILYNDFTIKTTTTTLYIYSRTYTADCTLQRPPVGLLRYGRRYSLAHCSMQRDSSSTHFWRTGSGHDRPGHDRRMQIMSMMSQPSMQFSQSLRPVAGSTDVANMTQTMSCEDGRNIQRRRVSCK